MNSTQQRMIGNPAKLDRMKKELAEKTLRESQLLSLKTTPLPIVKPHLKRFRHSKCGKCNTKKGLLNDFDDNYIEPDDALTQTFNCNKCSKGWKHWISVSVLRKLLLKAMTSLVFHPAQIKMLKNLQNNYQEVPLIFVVENQCTQFNLLLINFVLLTNGLKVPVIVSKESQEFTPAVNYAVNQLSLMMSFEDNSDHLKKHGNVIVSLNNFDNVLRISESNEAFLVPVSLNAEKMVENFSLKLFGNESLGIVKVNFSEPYSFKDFMEPSVSKTLSKADNEAFMKRHLESDIIVMRPVMSTNVVAFLMLTRFRDGATIQEIADKLDELRKEQLNIDFAFEGESLDIVEHALKFLGNLLGFEDGNIKPNVCEIIQLSNYAKALAPHFSLKSILVISALGLKNREKFVDFNVLISTAVDLCDLLQCELKFMKPCDDISEQLNSAFNQLTLDGILTKPAAEISSNNEQRARWLAYQYELEDCDSDDDGYQSRNTNNEVTINSVMTSELNFLKDVTMPILDAYLSAVYCLKKFKSRNFSEQSFVDVSTKIMREELEDGNSKYWESCAKSFMQSCLEWLTLSQMVESDGCKLKFRTDSDDSSSIKILINRIERFFEFP